MRNPFPKTKIQRRRTEPHLHRHLWLTGRADTGSRGQGRDRPPGGFAAGNQVAALLCRGLSVRAVFAG